MGLIIKNSDGSKGKLRGFNISPSIPSSYAFTDFSEYSIGSAPQDWFRAGEDTTTGTFEIVDSSVIGGINGKSLKYTDPHTPEDAIRSRKWFVWDNADMRTLTDPYTITVRMRWETNSEVQGGIGARYSGPESGVAARVSNATIYTSHWQTSPSQWTGRNMSKSSSPNTWYNIKFLVGANINLSNQGTNFIDVKMWEDGTPEPTQQTDWYAYNYEFNSVPNSYPVDVVDPGDLFVSTLGSGVRVYWDSIDVKVVSDLQTLFDQ